MVSTLASGPSCPGSNPGSAKIFSIYCLVREQYRDMIHLVLKLGISQMHLTVPELSTTKKSFLESEITRLKSLPITRLFGTVILGQVF